MVVDEGFGYESNLQLFVEVQEFKFYKRLHCMVVITLQIAMEQSTKSSRIYLTLFNLLKHTNES